MNFLQQQQILWCLLLHHSSKLKLSEMVDFFNGLPRTQDYVLGFSENQGVGFQATIGILLDSFERFKNAWLAGKPTILGICF